MGQHSPEDLVAHLLHGPGALSTSQGTSLWVTKLLCLCGVICRWQHPPTQSSLLCIGADGPMAWPQVLGTSAQSTQAELALAPSLTLEQLGSPSIWHCAATSLAHRGQGVWTHWLQVPPKASSLLLGCPGAALRGEGYKCQGKAPSCSATHPASPMETLWLMLFPLLSSAEGNNPIPCGPGP